MTARVVLGVDGGGTFTRALIADIDGQGLACAETGGSNPSHHPRAEENARAAIQQVLAAAGGEPGQVVALVAGFAGLDGPEDQEWADRFTAVPGLVCPRLSVNDAVIAHAGALRSQPGIIAISGTGSIVFGVTPDGRQVRNYDFGHYAPSTARHLSYEAVYRLIAGEMETADHGFLEAVLAFWGTTDVAALAELGAGGFVSDRQERNYRFEAMAGLVTAAAEQSVPIGCAVCDQAATSLGIGIRLVGACFPEARVPVALVGSVIRSPPVERVVKEVLARNANRDYQVVEPELSPVQGAVLMALERCGRAIDTALVQRLAETSRAVGSGGPRRGCSQAAGSDVHCLYLGNGGNSENRSWLALLRSSAIW
jgi:glucosamine kinase